MIKFIFPHLGVLILFSVASVLLMLFSYGMASEWEIENEIYSGECSIEIKNKDTILICRENTTWNYEEKLLVKQLNNEKITCIVTLGSLTNGKTFECDE